MHTVQQKLVKDTLDFSKATSSLFFSTLQFRYEFLWSGIKKNSEGPIHRTTLTTQYQKGAISKEGKSTSDNLSFFESTNYDHTHDVCFQSTITYTSGIGEPLLFSFLFHSRVATSIVFTLLPRSVCLCFDFPVCRLESRHSLHIVKENDNRSPTTEGIYKFDGGPAFYR